MDKLKSKAATARGRLAERTSRGTGSGSLAVPHSTLLPEDNASTTAVNEGNLGRQPATSARDFAAGAEPAHQPVVEPPTSLQSSVDAGIPVPTPTTRGGGGRPRAKYLNPVGLFGVPYTDFPIAVQLKMEDVRSPRPLAAAEATLIRAKCVELLSARR